MIVVNAQMEQGVHEIQITDKFQYDCNTSIMVN